MHTLKLGRPIYGGGGITPDVFVPLDTTLYSDYYRDLNAKGLINQFAIRYTDTNRKKIKAEYKDANAFEQRFNITQAMINELAEMAKKEGIEPKPEMLKRSEPTIKNVIKAIIARDVYGDDNLFYRILNSNNDIYKAALKLITTDEYDAKLKRPELIDL